MNLRDLEAAWQRTFDARAHLLVALASGTLSILDSQYYTIDSWVYLYMHFVQVYGNYTHKLNRVSVVYSIK